MIEVDFQKVLRDKLEEYYGVLEVEIEVFLSGSDFLEKFWKNPNKLARGVAIYL